MKAIVCTAFGSPEVLRLEEMDRPVPKARDILVKIRATTVTTGDRRVRSLDMPYGFGLISRLSLRHLQAEATRSGDGARRRRYPLEQIAEAHRHVDTGRKKGNVVITLDW